MSSGVTVSPAVVKLFQEVKTRKAGQNFMVMKIQDKKEVVVDMWLKCEKKCWKEVLEQLPPDDARYVLFDYEYEPSADRKNVNASKLILLLWCPECVPVSTKMIYASTKGVFRTAFGDLPQLQADCIDDCDDKEVQAKLKKI